MHGRYPFAEYVREPKAKCLWDSRGVGELRALGLEVLNGHWALAWGEAHNLLSIRLRHLVNIHSSLRGLLALLGLYVTKVLLRMEWALSLLHEALLLPTGLTRSRGSLLGLHHDLL